MRKKLVLAIFGAFVCAFPDVSIGQENRIDLSTIVTKTDAESALGEPVKEPQTRNGDGSDGYYSRCNYYSSNPGRSLVLRVHQSSVGKIPLKKHFETLSAGTGKIDNVSGLGDKAGCFKGGGEGNAPLNSMMLYVAKGNAFVTVGIGGMSDDKLALEKAKGLAKKILAQLQ